jgi:hypothetical protein
VKVSSQLILYKPNFLVFNYTELDLEEIRMELYDSYESVAEWEKNIPRFEQINEPELPLNDIFNRLISEICFNDTEEYNYMMDEQCDIFESEMFHSGWKINHDFGEILMMDHVCFIDNSYVTHNIPLVSTW